MVIESNPICVGCNYHTTWQRLPGMRFVLVGIECNKARLITRNTKRDFTTNISDLIFIESSFNRKKYNRLKDKQYDKRSF